MTELARDHIGTFGVWRGAAESTPELAAQLEALGFGALWLGGSPGGDLDIVEQLLDATNTLVVATGIVNVWADDAHQIAAAFNRIEAKHPGRFLLGVGVGHPEAVQQYTKPYEALSGYVETLLADGVPQSALVLAALGPKVLELSRDRAAGAHPYLVPVEHTRVARETLGAEPLLAPEHKVVLQSDPERARALGRTKVENPYLHLRNYTNNLKRLGWSDEDVAAPGSDALIDAVVAHGTADDIASALRGHIEAGADHVCLQLLTEPDDDLLDQYTQLATALGLTG